MKFKVGDEVVILDNIDGYRGISGTILRTATTYGRFCYVSGFGWYNDGDLELKEIWDSPLMKVLREND